MSEAKMSAEDVMKFCEDAYRSGDRARWALAFQQAKELSDAGSIRGRAIMGWCYSRGVGVEKSYEESAKLCLAAAEQGDCLAQTEIGKAFFFSHGVPKSREQAIKWLKRAADQGDEEAIDSLAMVYDEDKGVYESELELAKCYKILAEKGRHDAQYHLACCYEEGRGVPKSDAEALKWLNSAAALGSDSAQISLGLRYIEGNGVPKSATEAYKWYHRASELKNPLAMYLVAEAHAFGIGVPQSWEEAFRLLSKAEQFYPIASTYYLLGECYRRGGGVAQSIDKARQYYQLGADGGDENAAEALHKLNATSFTNPQNHKEGRPMNTVSPVAVAPNYQYSKEEDADGTTFTATSDGPPGGIILGLGIILGIILGAIFYNLFDSGWGFSGGLLLGVVIVAVLSGSGKQSSAKILKKNGDLIINNKQYDRGHIKQIIAERNGTEHSGRVDIKILYGDKVVEIFKQVNEDTGNALYHDFSAAVGIEK